MQSMLRLPHILIVLQIYLLMNFVHLESNHPSINFKWWRKRHNGNAHKNLIDEMSPSQFSRLQEEYNDIKIPIRHANKYARIDQVMCIRMGNCSTSVGKKEVSSKEVESNTAAVLPKIVDSEYLETRLRDIQKAKSRLPDIDHEAPLIEDLNDNAAVQTNRSHLQEIERRKQNPDSDLSPASKIKMEKGGNKQAINQLFQQIYKTSPPASVNKEEQKRLDGLANEHVVRAREETHCKKPTPISVRVSDVYHHPHKTYAPPCTRLYQCTEKSGCCSEPKRCMPYKTETVTLYFKVFTKIRGGTTDATVEALTFQNDTECRCKNTSIMNSGTGNSSLAETELQDESLSECICPAPFSKRIMNDGTCTCDCFVNDTRCLKYKRGEGYVISSVKKCIEEGQCTKPACEHGDYLMKNGRCPKDPHYNKRERH